jgi:hypothetical protein
VFSQVAPSGEGPAYLKTVLKGASGAFSQTRAVARGSRLGDLVREVMGAVPQVHPWNTPIVVADLADERIRVMVGPAAETWPD